MHTTMKITVRPHLSPRLLLLALLSVLALVAIAPAPASAQDGDGQTPGNQCTPDVDAVRTDETKASISLDCPDDHEIRTVTLQTTEGGSIEAGSGTSCTRNNDQEFECRDTDGDSVINAEFTNGQGDSVCAEPRLMVDFIVDFEDGEGEDETIENVEVRNCPEDSGGGEDDGSTPEGGVDSGAGGTAEPSSPGAATFPVAGAVLIVLAAAGLFRKIRPTR